MAVLRFAPGPGGAAAMTWDLGWSVGRSHLAAQGAAVTEIWASLLRVGMISSEAALIYAYAILSLRLWSVFLCSSACKGEVQPDGVQIGRAAFFVRGMSHEPERERSGYNTLSVLYPLHCCCYQPILSFRL